MRDAEFESSRASGLARLSINFFLVGVMSFGLGALGVAWFTDELTNSFYGPLQLAVVHLFTLGWITPTIMGVIYRYVPALRGTPLPFPRLARAQFVLYVIGMLGMVAHFALAEWVGLWWSALVVLASIALFAANLLPCMVAGLGRGVAETGMSLAIGFLLAAGILGVLLGINETRPVLSGDPFRNIAAHAHLAAVGWVTLTICAASYRFLPAFILPELKVPTWVVYQLYALALGVIGLSITLLTNIEGTFFWFAIIVVTLVSYFINLARLIAARRMPLGWAGTHAIAATVCLICAIVLGFDLLLNGAGNASSGFIVAYGVLGLFGWMGNYIVGMSYQLFPGFVVKARNQLQWPLTSIAELSVTKYRWFVFVAFNLGIALLAGSCILKLPRVAELGSAIFAFGALMYVGTTLWTLSFAYRRTVPSSALSNPLRIIP